MDRYLNPIGEHIPMAMMPANPHYDDYHHVVRRCRPFFHSETLEGWHCTRLTDEEVEGIKTTGMNPLSSSLVQNKVNLLLKHELIDRETADSVLMDNLGEEEFRQMTWFCFFEPRHAGQSGIERFFRYWGGEAVYVPQHSCDRVLEMLQRIGRPCLIKVDVPIASLSPHSNLAEKIVWNYLESRNFDPREDARHEDYSRLALAPENVIRFVFHGEHEFSELTGCDSWQPPLGIVN
jgi:hypothetical protein